MNLNMWDSRGIDCIKRDVSLRTGSPIAQTELWWRAIILSSSMMLMHDEWNGYDGLGGVCITCSQLYYDGS